LRKRDVARIGHDDFGTARAVQDILRLAEEMRERLAVCAIADAVDCLRRLADESGQPAAPALQWMRRHHSAISRRTLHGLPAANTRADTAAPGMRAWVPNIALDVDDRVLHAARAFRVKFRFS